MNILVSNNARILNPKSDFCIFEGVSEPNKHIGRCIVLLDGWCSFDFDEKEESKEKKPT